MLVIKFTALMLSMCGYVLFFSHRYKIRIEFMPATFMAICSNLLFICGILNFLKESAVAIFLIGFLLLGFCLKRRYYFAKRECIILGVYVAIAIYCAWLVRGSCFTHYDNFSHWALVVKNMLAVNRYPNFQDSIITFQAYPLGSATFIYYICQILGKSEACMIYGQLFLEIGMLFCGTVFINKKNIFMSLPLFLYVCYSLIANTTITNLLVDTLLPLCGVAAFAVLYYYQNDIKKALMLSSPISVLLVNIKNSGLFYSGICLILFFVLYKPQGKVQKIKCIKESIYFYIAPVITYLILWKRHVSYVFSSGTSSKHAMSLENYKNIFSGKSKEEIMLIGQKMADRIFSLKSHHIQILLICSILVLITGFLIHGKFKSNQNQTIKLIGCMWGVFVTYQISLWLMYIFSMPSQEAIVLASYDRYSKSTSIFLLGIAMIYILARSTDLLISRIRAKKLYMISLLILLSIPLFQEKAKIRTLYEKEGVETTLRYQYQTVLQNYQVPAGKSYLIYMSNDDEGYFNYLTRYELQSSHIESFNNTNNMEVMLERINDYDYLILWDYDEKIRDIFVHTNMFVNTELHGRMVIALK